MKRIRPASDTSKQSPSDQPAPDRRPTAREPKPADKSKNTSNTKPSAKPDNNRRPNQQSKHIPSDIQVYRPPEKNSKTNQQPDRDNNTPRRDSTDQDSRPRRTLNIRAQVIIALVDVMAGKSLSSVLPQIQNKTIERDKGLLNELVMGTLRHWYALDAQIQPMLSRPLDDDRVHAALLLGLYQILQTRIPAHAAISETVEAIKQLRLEHTSGLINALLRRSLRELDQIRPAFAQHRALPNWLDQQLQHDWPEQADQLAQVLRQSAPIFLRINRRQRSRQAYLDALHAQNIDAAPTRRPHGIVLLESVNIPSLIGFESGIFSVQDDHAQLCAELFSDLTGKRVLDACAAPGGKTAHLLERYDLAEMVALDSDPDRLKRVHENLARLQLNQHPHLTIKATNAAAWETEQPFDAILLDAPCTATGVIRRHPDIRLLRQVTDVAKTVAIQAKLLDHLWTQLAVDGELLYVTCSLLKAENEQQIAAFLARTPDAQEIKLIADWGLERPHGRQCLPVEDGGDGFYFAKLVKQAK